MDFWVRFWAVVLIAGIGAFGLLAIGVAIGGAYDIRALFRTLAEQNKASEDPPPSQENEA